MEKVLSPLEQRVLGALIEKEMTTPDYYPLTLNSLTLACNQKSNRRPVVEYSEAEVRDGFDRLRRLGVAMPAAADSGRVPKFRHCLAEEHHLEPEHLAIICELLLRGEQTVGELRTRAERLHAFPDLTSVEAVLDTLQHCDQPLVKRQPRRPGQKECRYVHLFGNALDGDALENVDARPSAAVQLDALAHEVAALREDFEALKARLSDLLD